MNTVYIVACIVTVIITSVFVSIDEKLFDNKKSVRDYIKLGIVGCTLVSLTIFLMGGGDWKWGASTATSPVQTGGSGIAYIGGEKIMTGIPNF